MTAENERPLCGRVLLISHQMSLTGAPNSLLRQAIYFRDAGYRVDVWTFAEGGLFPRYLEEGFRPEVVANDRRSVKAKYEASPVRYDLVVCNTTRTYRCVDVLQRYGLRIAWFIRETKLLDRDIWFRPDFAALFRRFYNLYTVSEYNAGIVRDYNPNVRVIHNSVFDDFTAFSSPPRKGEVRFGYIGSFTAVKGVSRLIAAYRIVHANFPGTRLRIAGMIPERKAAALRRQTATDDTIVWLGEVQRSGKSDFFDSVDVLCVPSLDEPSGLTVIEGAMYGKPVITTDRTGANYLVRPDSGRIVRARSVNELAEAMTAFAQMDEQEYRSRAERSREAYLRLGTPEVEREAVLRMVAESGPAPAPKGRLRFEDEVPLFQVRHGDRGLRSVLFRGRQLFAFRWGGVRQR